MQQVLHSPSINDLNLNKRIVLVNAPAVDMRIPWAVWQQPLALLQIGTHLKLQGCDVRLIDCLQTYTGRLSKEKVEDITLDGYKIDLWQFGLSPKKVGQILKSWKKMEWIPDIVMVSCGLSCWWKGATEVIKEIKNITKAPIILGGNYATSYPEHAASNSSAHIVVAGRLRNLTYLPTDLSIYDPLNTPKLAAIQAYHSDELGRLIPRLAEEVVDEIKGKCKLGVSSFVWYDEQLTSEHKEDFAKILDLYVSQEIKVADTRTKPAMILPGNLSPRCVDKDLALLLRKAKFRVISFHDDISHTPFSRNYQSSFDDYRDAVELLHNAGFAPRDGVIDAAIVVGTPGEDIVELTNRLVKLSSIVGTTHLVPYQYSPVTKEGAKYSDWLAHHNGHLDLTHLNGKLYPLIKLTGVDLENYWELTRLMVLLNSKFHSSTQDFLGNTFTAKMIKKSLGANLWNPFTTLAEVEQVKQ